MEKINVAELLKDCPKGMELDCINYNGVVTFEEIFNCPNYPIKISIKYNNEYFTHTLTKYGQTCKSPYNKCIIFPKGKTTWEGFHRPFKDGDIIYIRDEYSDATFTYVAILKQIEKGGHIYSHCFYNYEDDEFSTDDYLYDVYRIRFATEEEKQKLFQAIKDNGYKWNEEIKTLEKLPKFKVGDRVKIPNCDVACRVTNMIWNGIEIEYETTNSEETFFADELQPYKKETMDKVNKAVFDANAQCCDIMNRLIKEESIEEKYQEKIEEACKWLNNRLVRDVDTRNVKFIASDYDSIGDIIRDFRKTMQIH